MLNTSVRVLVVDDIESMRKILSLMLNRLGFESVETATHAEEAFKKLQEKEFGLLISDWQMEGTSGLDLLNRTRKIPKLRDIPIILVTAHSSEENSAAAKAAGAQGYLIKPFRLDVLGATIKEAFDSGEAIELQKSGHVSYRGCTLVPRKFHDEYQCHIFSGSKEVTALPPHASERVALDEAKLWVDQISTEEKPPEAAAVRTGASAARSRAQPQP
jgi:two-component system chemotaxis response regulator CheY